MLSSKKKVNSLPFGLFLCKRYLESRASSRAPGHLLHLGWTSCTCLICWSPSSHTTKCPACWNRTSTKNIGNAVKCNASIYLIYQNRCYTWSIINQTNDSSLCVFGRKLDTSSAIRQVEIIILVGASCPGAGNQEWRSALQVCGRET